MKPSGAVLVIVAAAIALLNPAAARAQGWPSKPVKIIAPFAAGGGADTLGRMVAEQLSAKFGQQFYIENRPGAGGLIGSQIVARAEPDGYTLGISSLASHVIAPLINRHAGYDPVRDFTHIAYFGGAPIAIIVNPSLGLKSFEELIALGKKPGERLTYASPGTGTNGHLAAEYFAKTTGIQVEHVPYRGGAPGVMDIVGGHLRFGSMTWAAAAGQIYAGSVIPLAVSSAERLPNFPSVPTLKELGYPELVCTTWFALSGPSSLSTEIVQKLNHEIIETLARPDVRNRLNEDQFLTEVMTPAEFRSFVEGEIAHWKPISERAGFRLN